MKHLILVLLIVLLGLFVGCKSSHTSGALSKNPLVLDLYPSGEYWLRDMAGMHFNEKGKWWRIEESVVVLVPSDSSFQERFANTTEDPILLLNDLKIYDTLREALADKELPAPTRWSLVNSPALNTNK